MRRVLQSKLFVVVLLLTVSFLVVGCGKKGDPRPVKYAGGWACVLEEKG